MSEFGEKVLEIVRNIPKGSVLTYAQVAQKAGNPNAARVAGSIMRKNFDLTIPCHRVIGSNGRIGDYNRGGEEMKRKLLKEEGFDTKNI